MARSGALRIATTAIRSACACVCVIHRPAYSFDACTCFCIVEDVEYSEADFHWPG